MSDCAKSPKVSYCTTCKGRLHHLMQTLPANLAAEKNNPNVEFVVLDYGSEDGLGEWIRKNFMPEIESGRLRYARTEQSDFEHSHAKNMAHRLATGDVLCNVDADNFIVPNFSRWLSHVYQKNPNAFVSSVPTHPVSYLAGKLDRKFLGKHAFTKHPGDITGRMAISRQGFEQIGGYDETKLHPGGEDLDLARRARTAGMTTHVLPKKLFGSAIPHEDTERWEHLSAQDRAAFKNKLEQQVKPSHARGIMEEYRIFSTPTPRRKNPEQAGCGDVMLNFCEPFKINPLGASLPEPSTDLMARRADWAQSIPTTRSIGIVRS